MLTPTESSRIEKAGSMNFLLFPLQETFNTNYIFRYDSYQQKRSGQLLNAVQTSIACRGNFEERNGVESCDLSICFCTKGKARKGTENHRKYDFLYFFSCFEKVYLL